MRLGDIPTQHPSSNAQPYERHTDRQSDEIKQTPPPRQGAQAAQARHDDSKAEPGSIRQVAAAMRDEVPPRIVGLRIIIGHRASMQSSRQLRSSVAVRDAAIADAESRRQIL